MPVGTRILVSDLSIDNEFVDNLFNRLLDQKFFYLGKGASVYYKIIEPATVIDYSLRERDYYQFITGLIKRGSGPINLISLGCGNLSREGGLVRKFGERMNLIGVDFSRPMIELARKELRRLNVDGVLLNADITSNDFNEEIKHHIHGPGVKIFSFLGGNISSVPQTYMLDKLYELMNKGDYLWLDAPLRDDLKITSTLKLYRIGSKLRQSKPRVDYWIRPLIEGGISKGSGEVELEAYEEDRMGIFRLKFSFRFIENCFIVYREKKIHFSQGERITLQNFRFYHAKSMIKFLELYDLKLVGKQILKTEGQFLFKKK